MLFTAKHLVLLLCVSSLGVRCRSQEVTEGDGAAMKKTEQEALYSAIQGFVGDWWNGSDLYPDPCGWTPIQGVSCDIYDGLWYVTGLSFGPVHENSLVCAENVKFRPQLFELKHLKSLSFFDCFTSLSQQSISGEGWLKLANSLESLEFRSNPGLIGPIPAQICSFRNLKSLVMLETGLTGEISIGINNLTKLKRLVLAGNRFTGKIPDLDKLSELLILDLSGNSLSGFLTFGIGGLRSLLKLDLSNNYLEGKVPKEMGLLKNLTLLDLRNNRLSGGLAGEIQEMSSITELVLSSNPLGGDLMGIAWGKLGNLVILDLSNMGLTGEIPNSMTELKRLRYLSLSHNNLTGSPPPKLEEALPCLGSFYINGNNLTGELQFSEEFYERMGRRFGAWGNPSLCFPLAAASTGLVPSGVKPCSSMHGRVNLVKPDARTQGYNSTASSGIPRPVLIGWLWMFLLRAFIVLLM